MHLMIKSCEQHPLIIRHKQTSYKLSDDEQKEMPPEFSDEDTSCVSLNTTEYSRPSNPRIMCIGW